MGHRSSLADTEEGRAFLQRRTARYALLVGGLGIAFWCVRAVGQIANDIGLLLEPTLVAHLVGALAMLAVWGINRSGRRSARLIHWSESAGLLASVVAYGAMAAAIPQPYRPDLTLVNICTLIVLTRAVMLPSTWQRTAGLCVVIGVDLVATSFLAFTPVDPGFAASFDGYQTDFNLPLNYEAGLNVGLWWTAMSVVAASASAVIYGLRREMSKAKQLGQYQLIRKIGEGGMGMVFEASHAMLRRPTAVKLLLPERVGEESLVRFEREVRATAALSHPNTITVFDYGRTPDGVFYYAMEYVGGGTLSDIVKLEGALPPRRAVFLLHQIAGALAEAHAAGLIHRDVKPDNVLVTRAGWMADLVKVVDFGLVKELDGAGGVGVTQESTIVGTPQYMAPETIRGDHSPDPRSDLYALGCVAYYLLTGAHVFEAKTVVEVCSLHLSEVPVAPSSRADGVSEPLDRLVLALLEKDPADRPASAEEVQKALEGLPEFGSWTREDAKRWWKDMGPDVASARQGTSIGSADTMAVERDLGSG